MQLPKVAEISDIYDNFGDGQKELPKFDPDFKNLITEELEITFYSEDYGA